jgi:hypothetical protein
LGQCLGHEPQAQAAPPPQGVLLALQPSKKFHVTADRMKARRDLRRDWSAS